MAPKTILVMRHAEKPDDPNDVNLSPAGYARADKLVAYIPKTFGVPDHIYAAQDSSSSHRPVETVTPLAQSLKKSIHSEYKDDDDKALADKLLGDTHYDDELILVCWHHGKIPKLLGHLKAPAGTYPDPWNSQVFNLIVRLDYTTSPPTVTQITEPF